MAPVILPTGKKKQMAEDLFLEIFCEVYGPEKTEFLYMDYPITDLYGNIWHTDFALQNGKRKIAIEIHSGYPSNVNHEISSYQNSINKYNSLTHQGWDVYRWFYQHLKEEPSRVKSELRSYIGRHPQLMTMERGLPKQRGRSLALGNSPETALSRLKQMRRNSESIAILYDAQGDHKYKTVAVDIGMCEKSALVIAHTLEQAREFQKYFRKYWPEVENELHGENEIPKKSKILFATFAGILSDLNRFHTNDFEYLVLDEYSLNEYLSEDHILSYFHPSFTLGLTSAKGSSHIHNMLEQYREKSHRLSLSKAEEIGEIPSVKCLRVKTKSDLTFVRINGMKYNAEDLEKAMLQSSRNKAILETWLSHAKNKKSIVFCSSITHAQELAIIFQEKSIPCASVSSSTTKDTRERILSEYEQDEIDVLFAVDMLNSSWNSPKTEVLMMACPRMSSRAYLQQLCRGIRKNAEKSHILVIDFVDMTAPYKKPWSVHRIFNVAEYRAKDDVLNPDVDREPEEIIDLYCWQEEARKMISQIELEKLSGIRLQSIQKMIQSGRLKPDLYVPYGNGKHFAYFYEKTVRKMIK